MLWWALQDLIISAALAGVVWAACRLGRVGPVARHALWLVVLIKLLTPPLIAWPWTVPHFVQPELIGLTDHKAELGTKPLPVWNTVRLSPAPAGNAPVETGIAPGPAYATHHATVLPVRSGRRDLLKGWRLSASQLLSLTLLAWAAGSLGFLFIQFVRIVKMMRRRRRSRAADAGLRRCVDDLARRWKVQPPGVRVVEGIGSPLVWALGPAEMWWPAELCGTLSHEAISCLVLHELAHIKRRDHWVGRLELMAGCVWWWNPLYWYVRHQLRENAELACDGWVVGTRPGARRAYGEALLAVCECLSRRPAPMPSLGIGTGGRQFIERRLAMILRENIALRLSRLGLMVVGLLATIALPAWSQRANSVSGSDLGVGVSSNGKFGLFVDMGSAPSSLPADAQRVLEQLDREQVQARLEAEVRIVRSTQQAIDRLQALQDQYAKAGQLDEAVAIRDRIRQLRGPGSAAPGAQNPPANLTSYRDRVGQSFLFDITGDPAGAVWGTDMYTDDSSLAAAAVHAGVVAPGERRTVRVTILPGRESYEGSTHNGVTSSSYGPWQGSYRIEAAERGETVLSDPGALTDYRVHTGMSFEFRVTGSSAGTIWGSGTYTDDSALATAAVHAGVLKDGESGVVRVTILPGQDQYSGTTAHGVTSLPYGPFQGSYKVEAAAAGPRNQGPSDPHTIRDLSELRGRNGESFLIEVVGSTEGTVWGSEVFTDDSSLPAAAVHAGVLRDGEKGTVKVTILPGRGYYAPSVRNGVVSQSWGPWQGSFRVEKAPEMY